MAKSLSLPRRARSLFRSERAVAVVEMALVLPLLLALLMGILVYGQYFLLAHNVQQAANDGARAAITGLDAADRQAIAIRAVDRSLDMIRDAASARGVAVTESSEAITVAVTYTIPEGNFLRDTFVPIPDPVVRAQATFELPLD